jgi:hypothetical protein
MHQSESPSTDALHMSLTSPRDPHAGNTLAHAQTRAAAPHPAPAPEPGQSMASRAAAYDRCAELSRAATAGSSGTVCAAAGQKETAGAGTQISSGAVCVTFSSISLPPAAGEYGK